MLLRVVGYARVSTREQSENSNALEQQIARLKAAGVTEIISDVESGSSDRRPGFLELKKLVANEEITEVVVTRLDRLTRKLKTLLEVRDLFLDSTVNLRALDDAIDISTVAGKFHLNLLGSLAEMETDRLSERVKHGISHMRKSQKLNKCPFGYKVNKDLRLEFDRDACLCLLEDKQVYSRYDIALYLVSVFLELRSLRQTVAAFHQKFGIIRFNTGPGRKLHYTLGWSHTGLKGWLTSPFLLGHTCYPNHASDEAPEIYYNTHEPLIDYQIASEINSTINHNFHVRGYGNTKRARFATTSLVVCAECRTRHRLVTACSPKKNYYYYQCKGWYYKACPQNKTITQPAVQKAIIEALTAQAEVLAQKTKRACERTNKNDAEKETLLAQLSTLRSLPYNVAIKHAIAEIEKQIENLERRQTILQKQTSLKEELLTSIFSLPDFWESQSEDDLKRIFRELVDRVWVLDGQIVSIDLKL